MMSKISPKKSAPVDGTPPKERIAAYSLATPDLRAAAATVEVPDNVRQAAFKERRAEHLHTEDQPQCRTCVIRHRVSYGGKTGRRRKERKQ